MKYFTNEFILVDLIIKKEFALWRVAVWLAVCHNKPFVIFQTMETEGGTSSADSVDSMTHDLYLNFPRSSGDGPVDGIVAKGVGMYETPLS